MPPPDDECVGLLVLPAENVSVMETVCVTPVGNVVCDTLYVGAPEVDTHTVGDTVFLVEPVIVTEPVEVLDCVTDAVSVDVLRRVPVVTPDPEPHAEAVVVLDAAEECDPVTETVEVLEALVDPVKEGDPVGVLLCCADIV